MSANNRYELLCDDDDVGAPVELLNAVTKKKQIKPDVPEQANSKSSKQNGAMVKKTNEKENKASMMNKNDSSKRTASAKGNVLEGSTVNKNRFVRPNGSVEGDKKLFQNGELREQRNNKRNFREGTGVSNFGAGEFGESRPPRPYRDRDNRGPPRNRFGEGGFRGGKREFDRQSGSDKTGVKAVDKRDGAGAHNWGSVKQEIEDINQSSTDAEPMPISDKDDSTEQPSTDQVAVQEEEDSREMTLDEWKATQQQRTKPQYNLRKAGEGEDTSQWKKMVVLNKKKKSAGDSDEELEYDPSLYPQRVGRLQRIVDIEFNFNDGRRGGGTGGGFGRGRGRGQRFPGQVDRNRFENDAEEVRAKAPMGKNRDKQRFSANALKVDDERQFPTLS